MGIWLMPACQQASIPLRTREGSSTQWTPHTADDELLGIAASVPQLAVFHHDVALVCPPSAPGHAPISGCEIGRLDHSGLSSRGIAGVMSAWWFDESHLLTLAPDLTLALEDGVSDRRILARGALDPRVADDGRQMLYIQLDGEPETFEAGDVGYMTVLDAQSGLVRRITDDPLDSNPWLVPASDDVLFTSARTGLASLWLAAPDGTVRQLTNIGKTEIDDAFIPVPSRELVWVPQTRMAVFSAHYGTHELWSIDVDTGEAAHIGPGRLPALHPEGGIVAVNDDNPSSPLQIVHYFGGAR